ncbi:Asp23/Gls24 family envelope stress response protein [Thermaerobacter sp. FW80]|uniref:Asp23/Gls24 family envelope stress response protein n=1 Tax=Thermaerobacter sp. FW80 TaxID=2546351 RepID=UPI0010753A72|nr:Asp23/Gls24 family envelope stress response protein [Thermaerobacter sp. FW80]QBS37776.1 Asp23/Gls24 family envelope stress response protein [Thermaerobacter sp. FW80]
MLEYPTDHGRIAISEEVVAGIAGAALADCPGVAGTVPRGWRQGLAGLLGEDRGRGVEVTVADDQAIDVTVSIVVTYGVPIQEVARTVMRRVGEAVRRAVGEQRVRVHVHVAGVRVPAGGAPGGGGTGAARAGAPRAGAGVPEAPGEGVATRPPAPGTAAPGGAHPADPSEPGDTGG